MNNDLYDINKLSISSDDGWQQMLGLLNEEMPLKRTFKNSRILLKYAAILMPVCMFISISLNNPFLHTGVDKSAALINKTYRKFNALSSMRYKSATIKSNNNISTYLIEDKKYTAKLLNDTEAGLQNSSNKIDDFDTLIKVPYDKKIVTGIIDEKTIELMHAAVILKTSKKSTSSSPPVNKNNIKRSWSMFAGLAANINAGNSQNLQPYPFAEARYNLSSRFYIAAGLSAWSPSAVKTGGISKTVLVNDTVNNIRLYNETSTYSHLYYADIPVSVGINISSKISIQSGIQLSVLLNNKNKKALQPYDFQLNSVNNTFINAAAPATQQDYNVQVHKFDYRLTTGIHYTVNKLDASLTYQYSLSPIGAGSNAALNKILALKMLYRIK